MNIGKEEMVENETEGKDFVTASLRQRRGQGNWPDGAMRFILGHCGSSACVGVQGSPTQSHHAFSQASLDGFDGETIYRDNRLVL